jgi:hypothetical protein
MILMLGSNADLVSPPVIDAWLGLIRDRRALIAALFASGICSVLGFLLRRRALIAIALFLPAQFMVTYGAFGIFLTQMFLSGSSPHSLGFTIEDQAPQFVMAFSHAAAIIWCVSPMGRIAWIKLGS